MRLTFKMKDPVGDRLKGTSNSVPAKDGAPESCPYALGSTRSDVIDVIGTKQSVCPYRLEVLRKKSGVDRREGTH